MSYSTPLEIFFHQDDENFDMWITAPTYNGRLTKTVLQQLFVTSLLSELLIVLCHYFVEWQKFNTQIFVVYFTNNFVKAS